MGDESRIPRYRAPKGELIERFFDRKIMVFRAVHTSGSGPGLLVRSYMKRCPPIFLWERLGRQVKESLFEF